jgi:hypothetical protein
MILQKYTKMILIIRTCLEADTKKTVTIATIQGDQQMLIIPRIITIITTIKKRITTFKKEDLEAQGDIEDQEDQEEHTKAIIITIIIIIIVVDPVM